MARVNAQQYAEKWARRMKGATEDMRIGVEQVSVAPGVQAAKKADKMLAGIQRAISDGTWQRAVSAVSLEDWKDAYLTKGIQRVAAGVDGAMNKQVQMATKLLAAVDAAVAKVNQMPDATLDDRINKSAEYMRTMANAKIK